jgi:hypothetical protein
MIRGSRNCFIRRSKPFLASKLRAESKICDIIATCCMSADPQKQQIPTLRCAPVGMTNHVHNFRLRTMEQC